MTGVQTCALPIFGSTMIFKNILFGFDKSTIQPESYSDLEKLTEILKKAPNKRVEISGHTDNKGPEAYNQQLSERRAKAVVNYLVKRGIKKERLVAKGYGESRPFAPNVYPDGTDNPKGRKKNRRTEITIIG